MPHVMLRRDWPGTFRRTIKNKKGKPIKRLEFQPGIAVEVTDDEVAGLRGDIGKCLLPVVLDEKARPRVIEVDIDATVAAASEAVTE